MAWISARPAAVPGESVRAHGARMAAMRKGAQRPSRRACTCNDGPHRRTRSGNIIPNLLDVGRGASASSICSSPNPRSTGSRTGKVARSGPGGRGHPAASWNCSGKMCFRKPVDQKVQGTQGLRGCPSTAGVEHGGSQQNGMDCEHLEIRRRSFMAGNLPDYVASAKPVPWGNRAGIGTRTSPRRTQA